MMTGWQWPMTREPPMVLPPAKVPPIGPELPPPMDVTAADGRHGRRWTSRPPMDVTAADGRHNADILWACRQCRPVIRSSHLSNQTGWRSRAR
jgi:hypothetical protein